TVNAASGEWLYTLDNANHQNLAAGETHTETFTVTVTDDQGRSEERRVGKAWRGPKDAQQITRKAQSGSVTEDTTLSASGQVSSRDVDDVAAVSVTGVQTGAHPSFTVNAASGEWLYTLDNANHQNLAAGETHTETFTVTVTDDQG